MERPIDIPETEEDTATLKRLIQEAIDEMKASRVGIQEDRREIARLTEETRILREETRAILSQINAGA